MNYAGQGREGAWATLDPAPRMVERRPKGFRPGSLATECGRRLVCDDKEVDLPMLVRDVMTKNLKTVTPHTGVIEVASLMCLYRFSGLPVVDTGNRLVGIVTEKDVLHRLFPTLEDLRDGMASVDLDEMMGQYRDVLKLRVDEVMTPSVISINPDMHLLRGAGVMIRHRFRRIPVVEDGMLVGMLTLGDVHKAIYQANVAKML